METIQSYLDNMFASLPQTGQMLQLKQEMLATMEEKYHELKSEGKSENEAVGIVISEFGNIDELMNELGITPTNGQEPLPVLTGETAEDYMAAKKRSGLLIGMGVFLCLLGVALLVLISTLAEYGRLGSGVSEDNGSMLGLLALFLLVVPAIGIFIYSGMKLEKFQYLQKEFVLPASVKALVLHKQSAFSSTYTLALITGVCLSVLSPVAIFISTLLGDEATTYGVSVMLVLVGIAVFLFVYYGSIRESHNQLLQTGDFTKEKKEENRVIGAVAAVVWPLAACAFLVSGFIFSLWHINWVIFPVTGILFGAFCGAYSIFREKSHS
ncbi:MAG: hypothetical protein K0R57_6623 [Paenibacillaceae bacterium]|jgi:hypothetical protein|nr:hypothetical protein [Paenibacillaceae bacterium]